LLIKRANGYFTACDNIGTHGWVVTKREAFDFRMTSRVASGHPESWDLGETPPPLRCPARTGGTHVIGRWGTASSRMRQQYAAVNPARLRRDQGRRPEARDYRLENSYTGAGTSASPVQGGHLGSGR